jgi:hypothetical protein
VSPPLAGVSPWRRERWNLLASALLTWALWPVHLYFRDQVPGSGPDGGEAIFLLLVTATLAWAVLTAINMSRLAARLQAPFWVRGVGAPIAGIALTVLAFTILAWLEPADIGSFALSAGAYLLPNLVLVLVPRR